MDLQEDGHVDLRSIRQVHPCRKVCICTERQIVNHETESDTLKSCAWKLNRKHKVLRVRGLGV